MIPEYLDGVRKLFRYYKGLGEGAMSQLPDEALFRQENKHTNSISIIVKHLWGNMLSRWTNFLTEDGEKEWRDRDGEFDNDLRDRLDLENKWTEGWKCLLDALDSITDEDLGKIIYIRNEGHTVLDAINRQLAHYSYHVGQIVHIAKVYSQDNWKVLSIAKNASKDYNSEKFAAEKHIRHFTDGKTTSS